MQMPDKRYLLLLKQLSTDQYHSAQALAEQLGMSSRSIRSFIKELNDILKNHGAQVISKYGAGYKIKVENPEKYQAFLQTAESRAAHRHVPDTSRERIQFLMEQLLYNKGYVKTDDLCDRLFVSKKTLAADLKATEKLLNEFNLKLLRKPNYGMKVEGREFDLRLCIANYITQTGRLHYLSADQEHDQERMRVIADCIVTCLRGQEFEISDLSLQNLIVHIFISMERIKEKHYVPLEREMLAAFYGRKEYRIAETIVELVNERFGINFPESEISYIAIHLAGKEIINQAGNQYGAEENLVISQKVSDLVAEMLQAVYEAFEFDLRDDLELQMSLSQHIVPLDIRLQYDMKMRNPLLKDIKKRYALAYAMASQACTVLNHHYQKELKADEIGYIALAFALALERQHTQIEKKNILLVCSSGKGSAQLLVYKYQQEFGDYINKITTCEVNNIYKVDFKEIDYIFTTVPIDTKVPVPIKEVRYFLEDSDIRAMKKLLAAEGNSILKYYDESLFLPDIKLKTKAEVLKFMCDYVMQKKGLAEEFYHSVLKREALARTDFGNRVAMPHPYKTISKDTFVCVGILEEPILWGEQPVQVVFLISIANQKKKDLQKFYQITTRFLMDSRHIQELIQKRDYQELAKSLTLLESEMGGK